MKLQLPTVTLMIIDCLNVTRAINVLEHCKSKADFGAVKLLSHIPTDYEHRERIKPLNSLIAYSIFMLTKVHSFIETDHVLIVQRDGWILNPESFNPAWLQLDYIGPIFVQYDHVGSGGFSLRSKKLMQNVASNTPEWNWTQKQAEEIQEQQQYYEDGVICLSKRFSQFKIASLEEAGKFAAGGNRNRKYFVEKPFGYHGVWHNIDHSTGKVFPLCEHEEGNCECTLDHVNYLQQNENVLGHASGA